MTDWREPYRSMDASGGPETAGQVGWSWMYGIGQKEHDRDPAGLELDQPRGQHQCILYRDRIPVAAYWVARDPMNHAILFRWLPADSPHG